MKKYYKRLKLEMCQYGYTPSDFKYRLFSNQSPKILANSIPKSGTNLLLRALYMFPSMHRKLHKTLDNRSNVIDQIIGSLKNGEICSAHLKYTDKIYDTLIHNDVKNIIIVRDPRDIAVSNCMYITYKDTGHRLSEYFINELKNDDQRIMASIDGIPSAKLKDGIESLSLLKHYDDYMKWKSKDCLIVRFEDLIGAKGGGTNDAQLSCVNKIVSHVGLDVSSDDIENVAKKIFNPTSRTFVKGQIGAWKKTMNDEHIDKIKSKLGDYLIDLGYEKDKNW